eukprot:6540521-Pyramimonas_sp.AAC.1
MEGQRVVDGRGIFLWRDKEWLTDEFRRARYIPIEGQRVVDGRGIFLLRDCDWSTFVVLFTRSGAGRPRRHRLRQPERPRARQDQPRAAGVPRNYRQGTLGLAAR